MVLTGVALAAMNWLLDSLLYFFSTPGAGFLQRLSGTDSYDSWTRIFVLCLFAIFGSHVQQTMNKHRESDAQLQASEKKYRTIIESMEKGCFEVDIKGTVLFVNGALCRMANHPAGTLIAMNTAATKAGLLAADEKFVHLNSPGDLLPLLADGATSELLQPAPGRLIAIKAQQLLQVDGIHACFPGGELPPGFKPVSDWLFGAVYDRTGS